MSPLSDLIPELKATGLPWHTERGTKHIKIFLCERLVGIVPAHSKTRHHNRSTLNVRAQIRRMARKLS